MITLSLSAVGTSGMSTIVASALEAGQAFVIVLGCASLHGWISTGVGVTGAASLLVVASMRDDAALLAFITAGSTQSLLGISVASIGLCLLTTAMPPGSVMRRICTRVYRTPNDRGRLHVWLIDRATPVLTVFACLVLIGCDTLCRAMTLSDARDEAGVVVIGALAAIINLLALGALFTLAMPRSLTYTSVLPSAMAIVLGAMLVSTGVFHAGTGLGIRWAAGEWTTIILATIAAAVAALATRIRDCAVQQANAGKKSP